MNRDNPLGGNLGGWRAPPDAFADITAFQLELADLFFFEEPYQFLDLFKVHPCRFSGSLGPCAHKKKRGPSAAHPSSRIRAILIPCETWSVSRNPFASPQPCLRCAPRIAREGTPPA